MKIRIVFGEGRLWFKSLSPLDIRNKLINKWYEY